MIKKMPKVSIILPTYNSEKFLHRTINSVLNQTFTDWELIIVDDCSTDNTQEIINDFLKKDKRIKAIFLKENSGSPALPHNVGFNNSLGEYIAYLDHDDEWFPNKIKEQLRVFENSPVSNLGLVSCNALIINQLKSKTYYKKIKRYESLEEVIESPGDFIHGNSSIMIKREVIEKVGERDEKLGQIEDFDMIIRIASSGYEFDFINEVLFKYYIHENNITTRDKYPSSEKSLKLAKQYRDFINKHKHLFEKDKKIYSNHLNNLANLYAFGEKKKEAIKCFLESIKNNPKFNRCIYLITLTLSNKLYKFLYKFKTKIKEYLKL
jgi:glycosyltransferase involved in cell wall biosynthesis